MASDTSYREWRLRVVAEAVAKGHRDPANLRELSICTTDRDTAPVAEKYFAEHRQDADLLRSLVEVALEGDDAGDAPWAAANIIESFPGSMLLLHKDGLERLAREEWEYLRLPATRALAKIAASEGAA